MVIDERIKPFNQTFHPLTSSRWSVVLPRSQLPPCGAMKETNGKKRSKALHKAEQMLLEDLPMAPMVFSKENYLIRPGIKGIQHLPSGHSYFMYCTKTE